MPAILSEGLVAIIGVVVIALGLWLPVSLVALRRRVAKGGARMPEPTRPVKEPKIETGDEDPRAGVCFCGEIATKPYPLTGKSWIDKIPIVTRVARLQGIPPRYVVEFPGNHRHQLCDRHADLAEELLHRAHSQLRAEHVEANARAQRKILSLSEGGLATLVYQAVAQAEEAFQELQGEAVPRLPPPRDDEVL